MTKTFRNPHTRKHAIPHKCTNTDRIPCQTAACDPPTLLPIEMAPIGRLALSLLPLPAAPWLSSRPSPEASPKASPKASSQASPAGDKKTARTPRQLARAMGIPQRDMVDLTMRTKAPAWGGWKTVGGLYMHADGHTASGLYNSTHRILCVAPMAGKHSLAHEVGHHVTLTLRPEHKRAEVWTTMLNDLYDATQKGWTGVHLSDMGLRAYSLTNWKELTADIYAVFYTRPISWKRLEAWAEKRAYHLREWLGLPQEASQ